MTCGVYKITSPSGRIYIGQSRNIEKRWKGYLRKDCKNQIKLKHSFEKYGVEAHVFEIVEECEFEQLNSRERYWQEFYDCVENGLNCLLAKTEDKPLVYSKETRERMSRANLGKIISEETKLKISRANLGKKHSEESKLKMRFNSLGKKMSEEACKKMSLSKLGRKASSETREKMRLSSLGRKHSEESKLKMRLALVGRKVPEKNKKKVIDTLTNKIYSSIKEAAEDINLNYNILKNMLSGDKKNATSLIYYNENKS